MATHDVRRHELRREKMEYMYIFICLHFRTASQLKWVSFARAIYASSSPPRSTKIDNANFINPSVIFFVRPEPLAAAMVFVVSPDKNHITYSPKTHLPRSNLSKRAFATLVVREKQSFRRRENLNTKHHVRPETWRSNRDGQRKHRSNELSFAHFSYRTVQPGKTD